MILPFDPVERAQAAEKVSMRGSARRYYRFRGARYYGGIVTGDAIGCSFLCAFCWNYHRNLQPQRYGTFYDPRQVGRKLIQIARRTGYHLYRITGSEPVLGERSLAHIVRVIEYVERSDPSSRFVLETNGFALGYHPELVERVPARAVMVRVAVKGTDEDSFERVSGARGEFFEYPLVAVKLLQDRGVRAWPAIMEDLFTEEEIAELEQRLVKRGIAGGLEREYLERYPSVLDNLQNRNVEIMRHRGRAV